jgi:Mg-chelatase subunit ChlD
MSKVLSRALRLCAALCLLWVSAGCLKLTMYNAAVMKPSQVALYFSLMDAGNNPVPNLTADRFKIYEDGGLVSVYESKQTILNPEVAAVHYTLLLVDLSGSISQSGALEQLKPAVQSFADRVSKLQRVAVYGFDGSTQIFPVLGFSDGGEGVRAAADRLGGARTKDPSTNLNGAVIEGLKVLDKALNNAPTPLRFGTLVVFTDGTDRARRVNRPELDKALGEAQDRDISLYVIGVGKEIDRSELNNIGRTGSFLSTDPLVLAKAFDEIAARVEAFTKSFYLLSYCSPARAQKHVLKVEASVGIKSGNATHEFDATGFGPNCDPTRLPKFDIHNPIRRKQPKKAPSDS